MIIQTSCSELLVDTAIHNPKEAFEQFKELFKEYNLKSSPPITVKLLQKMKDIEESDNEDRERLEVTIFDNEGHQASLEYGNNGYIHTGFRVDTGCHDYDENAYPILNAVEEYLNGEPIVCDGGHMDGYDDWKEKYEEERLPIEQKAYRRIQR